MERGDDAARVIASEIAPIESVRERLTNEVAIRLQTPGDRRVLEALTEIFSRHRGDRRVSFEVELPCQTGDPPAGGPAVSRRLRVTADVTARIRVRPSSALVAEVEEVVGEGSVRLR